MDYLLFSKACQCDGERECLQLRAYKQLRVDQLFDQRQLLDIELNTWNNGTCFFFCQSYKCWPFQDTCKAAHKCTRGEKEKKKKRREKEKKVAEWSERLTSRWAD